MNYYVIAKHEVISPCPACNGDRDGKKLCTTCGGSGKKITKKQFEIPLSIAMKAITTQRVESEKNLIDTNVDFLIDRCCEHFKISRSDILKRRPSRDVSDIRYMIYYYCTKSLKLTGKTTGKIIGNFCRTTVTHGTQKVQEWIDFDPEFNRKFNEFLTIIQNNQL
jgi:chromosomal replication initiation ATPase DnaA